MLRGSNLPKPAKNTIFANFDHFRRSKMALMGGNNGNSL